MSTYSNLKIEEITLGDSGWGPSTTNNLLAIQQALQSATLATGDFTSNVATLPWANTSATTNTPRAMVLNITATLTGAGTVNLPAITGGKAYLVINNSSGGYAVTVKVTGLTGISVPNGKAMWLWNNGTDVVDGVNYISSLALGAALPLASGGTGQTTANDAFNALAPSQASASGKYLKSNGTNTSWDAIDLSTSDISGILPVLNGGTGQSTATAAFNALAPTTTKGDLIANNGSGNVRLGIGSNNQVLVADSTQSTGMKWSNVPGATIATSITSASTITPDINYSQYNVTALAVPATIAAPSAGADGQKLILRFKDNGTARALTWTTSSGGFRVIGTTLPTTTVASKVTYIGCVYNSQDTYWDVASVITQT